MSGIDDLNFEDLIDGAINEMDDVATERFSAKKLIQPRRRLGHKTQPMSEPMEGVSPPDDSEDEMDTERMAPPPQPKRAKKKPPKVPSASGRATFEHIYTRAGIATAEFTVFRLQELYSDPELSALDPAGRATAVKAILKSHDVELETIVQDAIARRDALEAHDHRLKSNIQRVEREMDKENASLQTEIEEFANPRIEKMEKNNARVDRLRNDYDDWIDRKINEANRIAEILAPWDVGARVGHVDAPTRERQLVIPEPAAQAPAPVAAAPVEEQPTDVHSRDDVFDSMERPVAQYPDDDPWEEIESIDTPRAEIQQPSEATISSDDFAATNEYVDDVDDSEIELEFQKAGLRFPKTAGQWIATLFAVVTAVPLFVLLPIQFLNELTPPMSILLGIAPLIVAFVASLVSYGSRNFWSGTISLWLVFNIISFAIAHARPDNLVTNLTRRPLLVWHPDDWRLPDDTENALYGVTKPYADFLVSLGPSLGLDLSVWQPPKKAEDEAAADAEKAAPADDKPTEDVAEAPADPTPPAAGAADAGAAADGGSDASSEPAEQAAE